MMHWDPQNSTLGVPERCQCGYLNANDHYRLVCLNTQSTVGGTIWEGLESRVLLEEVC